MTRLSRLGPAAAIAVASLTSIGAAAPAQAATFSLQVKVVSTDWVPRTGNLAVTARIDCSRRVTSASWAVKVRQRVPAKGLEKISCTGEPQLLTILLDPKKGRFHPGAAMLELTTVECLSDVCAGLIYPTNDFRIPPPGQSHRPGTR